MRRSRPSSRDDALRSRKSDAPCQSGTPSRKVFKDEVILDNAGKISASQENSSSPSQRLSGKQEGGLNKGGIKARPPEKNKKNQERTSRETVRKTRSDLVEKRYRPPSTVRKEFIHAGNTVSQPAKTTPEELMTSKPAETENIYKSSNGSERKIRKPELSARKRGTDEVSVRSGASPHRQVRHCGKSPNRINNISTHRVSERNPSRKERSIDGGRDGSSVRYNKDSVKHIQVQQSGRIHDVEVLNLENTKPNELRKRKSSSMKVGKRSTRQSQDVKSPSFRDSDSEGESVRDRMDHSRDSKKRDRSCSVTTIRRSSRESQEKVLPQTASKSSLRETEPEKKTKHNHLAGESHIHSIDNSKRFQYERMRPEKTRLRSKTLLDRNNSRPNKVSESTGCRTGAETNTKSSRIGSPEVGPVTMENDVSKFNDMDFMDEVEDKRSVASFESKREIDSDKGSPKLLSGFQAATDRKGVNGRVPRLLEPRITTNQSLEKRQKGEKNEEREEERPTSGRSKSNGSSSSTSTMEYKETQQQFVKKIVENSISRPASKSSIQSTSDAQGSKSSKERRERSPLSLLPTEPRYHIALKKGEMAVQIENRLRAGSTVEEQTPPEKNGGKILAAASSRPSSGGRAEERLPTRVRARSVEPRIRPHNTTAKMSTQESENVLEKMEEDRPSSRNPEEHGRVKITKNALSREDAVISFKTEDGSSVLDDKDSSYNSVLMFLGLDEGGTYSRSSLKRSSSSSKKISMNFLRRNCNKRKNSQVEVVKIEKCCITKQTVESKSNVVNMNVEKQRVASTAFQPVNPNSLKSCLKKSAKKDLRTAGKVTPHAYGTKSVTFGLKNLQAANDDSSTNLCKFSIH